jgi:hypothetical protein
MPILRFTVMSCVYCRVEFLGYPREMPLHTAGCALKVQHDEEQRAGRRRVAAAAKRQTVRETKAAIA